MFEEKQILQWFVRVFTETGPTFEKTILGSKSIDTIEPENIESLLSTNFSGESVQIVDQTERQRRLKKLLL